MFYTLQKFYLQFAIGIKAISQTEQKRCFNREIFRFSIYIIRTRQKYKINTDRFKYDRVHGKYSTSAFAYPLEESNEFVVMFKKNKYDKNNQPH